MLLQEGEEKNSKYSRASEAYMMMRLYRPTRVTVVVLLVAGPWGDRLRCVRGPNKRNIYKKYKTRARPKSEKLGGYKNNRVWCQQWRTAEYTSVSVSCKS